MDIERFPQLDHEEFTEACHYLDRQYCQAKLGSVRRQWKMSLCTSLDLTSHFPSGQSSYIQIIRPLETPNDDLNLLSTMEGFSFSEAGGEGEVIHTDDDMIEAEEADMHVIERRPSHSDVGYVTYEIHLHPTYQVPCLWFSLHGLPPDEPAFNIDTVFRRLVPDEYKSGLRQGIGGIGGISADHHPITGLPTFFIHPCLLGDAISPFNCTRENYLRIWLGLVGGCVGLWVPKEMVS